MVSRKWEYLTLLVGEDGNVLQNEDNPTEWDGREFNTDVLPKLGNDGWEMCAAIPGATSIDLGDGTGPVDVTVAAHEFYFKRLTDESPVEEDV